MWRDFAMITRELIKTHNKRTVQWPKSTTFPCFCLWINRFNLWTTQLFIRVPKSLKGFLHNPLPKWISCETNSQAPNRMVSQLCLQNEKSELFKFDCAREHTTTPKQSGLSLQVQMANFGTHQVSTQPFHFRRGLDRNRPLTFQHKYALKGYWFLLYNVIEPFEQSNKHNHRYHSQATHAPSKLIRVLTQKEDCNDVWCD